MVYKLKIAYDGSNFHGFAKQKDVTTVQGELEKMLSFLFEEKINVFGSGRTDRYVHAVDQTVHFKSDRKFETDNLRNFLNKKIKGIRVKTVEIEDESFHSRFSIKNKTYVYVINTGPFDLFRSNYEYQYNSCLDAEKMKEIVPLLVGKKDFKSFSTSENDYTVRTVNRITILKQKDKIYIAINGNGFLRNMVRMMVGVMIRYAEGKMDKHYVMRLLNEPKKGSAVQKAPGCGLYLLKTNY